jgi:hypothetical protein
LPELYEKLMSEHRVVSLRGERLEFKLFPKDQENYILSEEEDEEEAKHLKDPQTPTNTPDPQNNNLESVVNKWKHSVMDKVPRMFNPTLETVRQKEEQLRQQYKEGDPFHR